MAEPIPSASSAVDAADEEIQPLPKNAEDRKAAAALNALKANEMTQESAVPKQPSAADQEALGKAMSRLEIASGISSKKKDEIKKKDGESKKEEVAKKKIKIASEDVIFLMEELDLSKVKATDLLRAHDGDVMKAATAFVTLPLKV